MRIVKTLQTLGAACVMFAGTARADAVDSTPSRSWSELSEMYELPSWFAEAKLSVCVCTGARRQSPLKAAADLIDLPSLGTASQFRPGPIFSIRLLGGETTPFRQTAKALTIQIPERRPNS